MSMGFLYEKARPIMERICGFETRGQPLAIDNGALATGPVATPR